MLELGLAAGGMLLSLMGQAKSSTAASGHFGLEKDNAQQELNINNEKRKAMEIDARRRNLEIVRNNQKARSLAQTSATASGAQFGSGLQGAYGGIAGQSETNLLGVNQNLEIGRNIFGFDTKISQNRIADAGYQSDMNSGQGMSQLGGAITNSAGKLGQMGSSLGNGFGNNGGFDLFSMGIKTS